MNLEEYQKINNKIQEAQRFLLDASILKSNIVLERDNLDGCKVVLFSAIKMIDKFREDGD